MIYRSRSTIGLSFGLSLATAGQAQEVAFADIDANGDGVLTGDELDHFSPRAQQALMRFDRDGDGFVTLNEVRSSDDPVGERGNRVGQERTAQGQDRETRNQGGGNGGERRSQGNGNGQRN